MNELAVLDQGGDLPEVLVDRPEVPQYPPLERPFSNRLSGHPVGQLLELLLVIDRHAEHLPGIGELGLQVAGVAEAERPLRSDPVVSVIESCVGCGLCGEVAHAAVLCPSFYRAEVIRYVERKYYLKVSRFTNSWTQLAPAADRLSLARGDARIKKSPRPNSYRTGIPQLLLRR